MRHQCRRLAGCARRKRWASLRLIVGPAIAGSTHSSSLSQNRVSLLNHLRRLWSHAKAIALQASVRRVREVRRNSPAVPRGSRRRANFRRFPNSALTLPRRGKNHNSSAIIWSINQMMTTKATIPILMKMSQINNQRIAKAVRQSPPISMVSLSFTLGLWLSANEDRKWWIIYTKRSTKHTHSSMSTPVASKLPRKGCASRVDLWQRIKHLKF